MPSRLPAPVPAVDPGTGPFWDATTRGLLLLPCCTGCGRLFWPPRPRCPGCGSEQVRWQPAAGSGQVHSFTVVRRGAGEYREVDAYVLAYVELDEGPRILTNIVDVDADSVRIGMAVTVVFHDTGAGSALPRFRPVPPAGARGRQPGHGGDQPPRGGAAGGGRR